jgi:hypothetical protein
MGSQPGSRDDHFEPAAFGGCHVFGDEIGRTVCRRDLGFVGDAEFI